MWRIASVALAAAVLAAGCGGDDDKGTTQRNAATPGAPSQEQLERYDADAKSKVRKLTTLTEACHVDEGSYTPCQLTPDGKVGGEDTGLPYGAGVGRVESVTSDDDFEITAMSRSGTIFLLRRSFTGSTERTCTKRDRGGCPPSGVW